MKSNPPYLIVKAISLTEIEKEINLFLLKNTQYALNGSINIVIENNTTIYFQSFILRGYL